MRFTVTGEADMGKGRQPFERTVDVESEKQAREQVYAELGSEHGASRANITIENVEQEE